MHAIIQHEYPLSKAFVLAIGIRSVSQNIHCLNLFSAKYSRDRGEVFACLVEQLHVVYSPSGSDVSPDLRHIDMPVLPPHIQVLQALLHMNVHTYLNFEVLAQNNQLDLASPSAAV